MDVQCNACTEGQKRSGSSRWGIITGLFLAILPKCPFCIVAYSSTAMLCGEGVILETTRTHHSVFTIIVSAVLGSVTLLSIFLNRRGARTFYAFMLALLGNAMVLMSVVYWGGLMLYYSGVLILFAGVWLNGSFLWAWKQITMMFPGKVKQGQVAGEFI
jgi:hypothetical protein